MRRSGCTPQAIVPALLLLAAPGIAAAPVPRDRIEAGLADLHQGLYTRAEEIFRAAARDAPEDPEPELFVAFTRWWRILLEDRGRRGADDVFDAAIEATIAAGEGRLRNDPGDARAMGSTGAARVLRSHIEALRRNYFHAAQEARRGKKLLEAALDRDPGATEALFALGALNYYADKVPALIKGLRALLFLPGGDADRGLAQLQAVAASSAHFRTDARLLLALICGSRDEGCFTAALAQLSRALADNPGSPLILGSIGELQMRLGLYGQAARSFEEGLRGAADDDPDHARQRRQLRVALAEALAADWRLDRAAAVLREADRESGAWPESARKVRDRTALELAMKLGEAPLPPPDGDAAPRVRAARAVSTDGEQADPLKIALRALEEDRLQEALAGASDAVRSHPERPLPRFVKGCILMKLGRDAEAEADLASAADLVRDVPPWMEGWIELDRGLANRRRGRERAARGHFHRASEVRRFRSADRGVMELLAGEPRNPRCAP